jgi:glycosyltransferase involved in cell wall biosynthesis
VHTLNIQKTNIIEKGLGMLLIENQFLKEVKKHFSNITFDLVLYSTPPITFTKIIQYIKRKDQAKSYLLLKDIFPQNAVDLKMIRKDGIFHKFFTKKEKELYKCSDFIGCMSPANVDFIIKHNPRLNPNIIEVNPNSIAPVFSDLTFEEKKLIREEYGILGNAIVFNYGGNLGKPQGIDFLIEVLESNLNNSKVFFIVSGGGTEYKKVYNWFKVNKPKNALLLPGLEKVKYDKLLKACDVGLIFLDKRFTIPNFPSRLLSFLENKMPILAATDKSTDIGKIIEESGCGFWCESGNIENFNKLLNSFNNRQLISEMGKNAYNLLMRNYTVDVSYNSIIQKMHNRFPLLPEN